MYHFSATTGRRRTRAAIVALGSLTLLGVWPASQAAPTRSTSIALTGNGTRLVNVNHEADSVTLFDVRGGRPEPQEGRRDPGGPGALLCRRGPARRRHLRHQRRRRHRVGDLADHPPGHQDDPGRHRAQGLRLDPRRRAAVRRQPHGRHGLDHQHQQSARHRHRQRRRQPLRDRGHRHRRPQEPPAGVRHRFLRPAHPGGARRGLRYR